MAKREELIELVQAIQKADDLGQSSADLVRRLRGMTDFPRLEEILRADYGPEYIADRMSLYRRVAPGDMPNAELAALVQRVRAFDGTEAEVDAALDILGQALRDPEWRRLVRDWSKGPEEVVRLGLGYRGPSVS